MSYCEIEIDEADIAAVAGIGSPVTIAKIPAGATIGLPFRRGGKLVIPYETAEPQPCSIAVGINGLTEAETAASASVMGLTSKNKEQ